MYSYFSRCYVTTNSVAPPPLYKLHTTHNSLIRSDEGLTLETSALESLYGGQFTLSTPLILPKFLSYLVSRVCRSHTTRVAYKPVVPISMDGNECCKPRLGGGDDERSFQCLL